MKFNDKKSRTELTKYHLKDYWHTGNYGFSNSSGDIEITKWGEVELIIHYPSAKEQRQQLQNIFARLVTDGMIIFD